MLSFFSHSFLYKKIKNLIFISLFFSTLNVGIWAFFYTSLTKQTTSLQRLNQSYKTQLKALEGIQNEHVQKFINTQKQSENARIYAESWSNAFKQLFFIFSKISQNLPPAYSLFRLTIEIPTNKNHSPDQWVNFSTEGNFKKLSSIKSLLLKLQKALPNAIFSIQDIKKNIHKKIDSSKPFYIVTIKGTLQLPLKVSFLSPTNV